MAQAILAANQVASAVSNLKSRYYKYLETLCQANGIDIANLKTAGPEQEMLEMFFGGLPVLIGLKYFERLRVLKLFGQDIVNLKPLIEVSGTLEELWICEGPIKCLDGLENCVKIRKLYVYECQIENGAPIGGLKTLDTLWIMNNKLKDFVFLDELQFLTELYIGGPQFSDQSARSVEKWSTKLQTLNFGGNSLNSYQSLLRLSSCGVIRDLALTSEAYPTSTFIENERHLAWLFYHFPYLERFNYDQIDDKQTPIYIATAEMTLYEAINKRCLAEKVYLEKISVIEQNFSKIQEKLKEENRLATTCFYTSNFLNS